MHLVSIHARRRTNSAGRFVQESRSWGKQPASQIRGPESRGPKTDRDPERWTQGMERREQRDREYRRYRVELRLRRRRNKKDLNAAGGIYKGRERFRFLKIKRIMRPLHPPPSSGWYPSGRPHTVTVGITCGVRFEPGLLEAKLFTPAETTQNHTHIDVTDS
ncbi:hypothetical protein BHE74_00007462 [Ensete ventricosum]|nr:hypothetical protein BHE74_00007462 [Ensete ventricosum]